MSKIEVKFYKAHENAQLPVYGSEEAAGADVHSVHTEVIPAGKQALIDTGLDCRIPKGYELQVRPRSGLAAKHMITVMNSPGTVDSDYTGRLKVILANLSDVDFVVEVKDRIAQIVVAPVIQAAFSFTEDTRDTKRGEGGFGSTGV